MSKYLDMNGLSYLWEQIKSKLTNKVDKVDGKDLSSNDYTTLDKNKLANIEANANNYQHPQSGVISSSYRKVTVDLNGHVTSGSNPTTLEGYGITDAANINHTHTNDDIVSIDASKITGQINIEQIPKGALERLCIVSNDTERFALTNEDVQKGDTVKVSSTNQMYFVVDETKLSSSDGYEDYTAGSATSVSWSGITDKPDSYAPSSHTHTKSQITDMPTSLKNPNALTISVNGSLTAYDGSSSKTITVSESTLGITSISNSEIDTIIES